MNNITRYHIASAPSAVFVKLDFLMEELGYRFSTETFVGEACLEENREEEWMLRTLRRSERGEGPRRGTRFGSPRETAWRLDASGLIAQIQRESERNGEKTIFV